MHKRMISHIQISHNHIVMVLTFPNYRRLKKNVKNAEKRSFPAENAEKRSFPAENAEKRSFPAENADEKHACTPPFIL